MEFRGDLNSRPRGRNRNRGRGNQNRRRQYQSLPRRSASTHSLASINSDVSEGCSNSRFYLSNGFTFIKGVTDVIGKCEPSLSSLDGLIVFIDDKHTYGFINSNETVQTPTRVYFQLKHVYNSSSVDVQLIQGLPVKFDPCQNRSDKAYRVYVGEELKSSFQGEVMFVEGQYFHVSGDGKYVFVSIDKISKYSLNPKPGDSMSLELHDISRDKFVAKSAKIISYTSRTELEIYTFFEIVSKNLQSSQAEAVLFEICSSKQLWHCLCTQELRQSMIYVLSLCHFLCNIFQGKFCKRNLLATFINFLFTMPFFQCQDTQHLPKLSRGILEKFHSSLYGEEVNKTGLKIIQVFFNYIVALNPEILEVTSSFINSIIDNLNMQQDQKSFMKSLLQSQSQALQIKAKNNWKQYSAFMNQDELNGHLIGSDQTLPKVQINTPYQTGEDYMNTYFKLLKAEIFSSIQRGIQDLKSQTLDERNMYCYYDVRLSGFYFSNSQMCMALKFTPSRPNCNWATSPQLMYGNLLCISPSGKFNDIIWATVAERDDSLLNKAQTILVSICDENMLGIADICDLLDSNTGRVIMVESPTYFNALHPVLKSLQDIDIYSFLLGPSIFKAQMPEPFYDETEGVEIEQLSINFDESQKNAFEFCIWNKLAIIQGPPGTGKTYIGVKLVQAFLLLKKPTPILLLTYKNHALDEFLKHLLKDNIANNWEIVRIGGRSKEPELNNCNLNEFVKNYRVNDSSCDKQTINQNIFAAICEIELLQKRGADLVKLLDEKSNLQPNDVLSALNSKQLENLIRSNHRSRFWAVFELTIMSGQGISLEEIVKSFLAKENLPETHRRIAELLKQSVESWWPKKDKFIEARHYYLQLVDKTNNDAEKNDEESFLDEEDIKEMKEQRFRVGQSGGLVEKNIIIRQLKQENECGFCFSDFPNEMIYDANICNTVNISKLSTSKRMQFIYTTIIRNRRKILTSLQNVMSCLAMAFDKKKHLEETRKLDILKSKKIIGMTITGAALHRDLLKRLGPRIVIVEEAAEILEPCLLASLNEKTEQLIMIGDHEQLRPTVDTYELKKIGNFDVSMMERLIKSGFPFKGLKNQSRMRPEISLLLKDIYPKLQDNIFLVLKNPPLPFMKHSVFFWSHEIPEDSNNGKKLNIHSRSKINTKEAEMVVALVIFMLIQGCEPSDITILAAYVGQTKTIRKLLQVRKSKLPKLFTSTSEKQLIVQTIDNYQGDENKYVVVSLVRSGVNSIGFLDTLNRRCVAQSRAKCGLYFVGNVNNISQKFNPHNQKFSPTVWSAMIEKMKENGTVGSKLHLKCPRHPSETQKLVEKTDLEELISQPETFCLMHCGLPMSCGIKEHFCEYRCSPKHQHDRCEKFVLDTFPLCNHPIRRRCREPLSSIRCETKTDFTFSQCGHKIQKKCHVRENKLKCNVEVITTLTKCGHKERKKCFQEEREVICTKKCEIFNSCLRHRCDQECGKSHSHFFCNSLVNFNYPDCGHSSPEPKKCSDIISSKCKQMCGKMNECQKHFCTQICGESHTHYCNVKVHYTFPVCKHHSSIQKKCSEPISWLCNNTCNKLKDCKKHKCTDICGQIHSHAHCDALIEYKFPICNHPSPKRKKCSEQITWPCLEACGKLKDCQAHLCFEKCGIQHGHSSCDVMIDYLFPDCNHPSPFRKKCTEKIIWKCKADVICIHPICKHQVKKECNENIMQVECTFPCQKLRSCKHLCRKRCGQDCNSGQCGLCLLEHETRLLNFRNHAREKVKLYEQKIRQGRGICEIKPLLRSGDTSAEFMTVEDKVVKYIQPMHNWFPTVSKIEKIENLELLKKFEQAKLESNGNHIDSKFHGTSEEGISKIPLEGFRAPGPPKHGQKPGMYGQGIYFATDSSKSAQAIYTKGSNKLLLCDVLLGKSKRVERSDQTLSLEKLRQEGFDSVFAPRNTRDTGGVLNDEFVIFDPRQALPKYIIHFSMGFLHDHSNDMSLATMSKKSNQSLIKRNIKPSRTFDLHDPFHSHFRNAEHHFLRMMQKRSSARNSCEIESIDIVYNQTLEEKFEAKKQEFSRRNITTEEVLAFHGTPAHNLDSILKENLQMKYAARQVHGPGNYFSEFPDISLGYGNGLLLFRVLPGEEFTGQSPTLPPGYNSKKVNGTVGGYGEMLIIENSSQFVPYAVYHLKTTQQHY